MDPKRIKQMASVAAAVILVVVAAVLIVRFAFPETFQNKNHADPVTETPTIASTPRSTGVAVEPKPSTIPGTSQPGTPVPCFVFEQLPPFAFTPDGSALMVRVSAGVQVFNIMTGELESFITSSQNLTAAALSPNGETLAWALADNTIQLVRVSDHQVLHNISGHTDMVTRLGFTPDGSFLVSAAHDRTARVWNLSGEEVRSFQTDALGIGISPDGALLATIPFDGPVTLWDLATGEKVKDLGGTGGYDTSDAVFSPDGKYLAADLAAGLFMWRISDAGGIMNGSINSMAVAFSPDGRYLALSAIGEDNRVIIANPTTAQYIRDIDQMQSPVWELIFSPDASLLAITDGVGIHIRQVDDGKMVAVGKSSCP